jgi:predicted XRE-type DNA-binding protein
MIRKSGPATAELKHLRAEVAAAIQASVKAEGLSTLAAAQRTGIHRTEFSRIMNGHLEKFALDRLVYVAIALGMRCSVRLRPPQN